jgi:branched-subunit amino acid transport protein AzlD
MIGVKTALVYTLAAALSVFFCRALPFLLIRRPPASSKGENPPDGERPPETGKMEGFLSLIERVVPPVAMTVLALNSVAAPLRENWRAGIPALAASVLTLGLHLWRRNFLLSILGGTAAFMVFSRFFMQG